MKHFQDDYYDSVEENQETPIGGLSPEEREYFNSINDDKSMMSHSDDEYDLSNDDSGTFKHFQD